MRELRLKAFLLADRKTVDIIVRRNGAPARRRHRTEQDHHERTDHRRGEWFVEQHDAGHNCNGRIDIHHHRRPRRTDLTNKRADSSERRNRLGLC